VKKQKSRGIDQICDNHLQNGLSLLLEHLTLLFQIIFFSGFLPDLFSAGIITLVIKKGKPADNCNSHRPINVSPMLCKINELLVIDDITIKCYTPMNQFGLKKR